MIIGLGDVKYGFYFLVMLIFVIFLVIFCYLYMCDVMVIKKSFRDCLVVKIFIEKVVKNVGGGGGCFIVI